MVFFSGFRVVGGCRDCRVLRGLGLPGVGFKFSGAKELWVLGCRVQAFVG